jgi:hypothetical protein
MSAIVTGKVTRATLSLREAVLAVFVLYLLFGAIPRFISFGNGTNTLPLTEVLLYLTCGLAFIAMPNARRYAIRASWTFCLVLIASAIVGVVLNGAQPNPLLMNIRLQTQIVVAVILGYLLWTTYQSNCRALLRAVVHLYLAVSLFSLGILLAFPDSSDLYDFLASIGIPYFADPHVWRLVSPYLDPNLFGAIILLPLLLSVNCYLHWRRSFYLFASGIMTAALMLTVSRSGIGVALGVFGLISLYQVARVVIARKVKASVLRRAGTISILAIVMGAGLWMAFGAQLMARLETPVDEEGSALMRVESFELGLAVMEQHPLFGIGYNYGIIPAAERTLVSEHQGVQVGFDSSLQTTMVNFGAVPTVLLLAWFVRWSFQTRARLRQAPKFARTSFALLVLYIVVTGLITSLANNVMYYQFWLMPIISLCTYFSLFAGCVPDQSEEGRLRTRM